MEDETQGRKWEENEFRQPQQEQEQKAVDAQLGAGLDFVADVNLRRRIVPGKHYGQARRPR